MLVLAKILQQWTMNETTRKFEPVSLKWKIDTCDNFSLRHTHRQINGVNSVNSAPSVLGRPTEFHAVKGDGNCFFRALAYVICGNEDYHEQLRHLLVSFEDKPQVKCLRDKHMSNDGVWATENEIMNAAILLNISIFVYSKYGSKFDWLEFKPLAKQRTWSSGAIYLFHKNLDHYDVVMNVSDIPITGNNVYEHPIDLTKEDDENNLVRKSIHLNTITPGSYT